MQQYNEYLVPLYLSGTLLITAFALSITVFFIIQKRKQVNSFLAQQKLKVDYEHSLLNTRIEVQEQAFETVSRDIHDGIGQMLSLGCVQLAHVRNQVADPALSGRLLETLELFKKSVKDLRLLSHSLNTGLIEQYSLAQSVMTELNRIRTFSKLTYLADISEEDGLDAQQRLVVFRIIQEALQNILKHADATAIELKIVNGLQEVIVMVRDNGKGFAPQAPGSTASMGLLSMRQRAELLRATLQIDSAPGAGTTLRLVVPLNQ